VCIICFRVDQNMLFPSHIIFIHTHTHTHIFFISLIRKSPAKARRTLSRRGRKNKKKGSDSPKLSESNLNTALSIVSDQQVYLSPLSLSVILNCFSSSRIIIYVLLPLCHSVVCVYIYIAQGSILPSVSSFNPVFYLNEVHAFTPLQKLSKGLNFLQRVYPLFLLLFFFSSSSSLLLLFFFSSSSSSLLVVIIILVV